MTERQEILQYPQLARFNALESWQERSRPPGSRSLLAPRDAGEVAARRVHEKADDNFGDPDECQGIHLRNGYVGGREWITSSKTSLPFQKVSTVGIAVAVGIGPAVDAVGFSPQEEIVAIDKPVVIEVRRRESDFFDSK